MRVQSQWESFTTNVTIWKVCGIRYMSRTQALVRIFRDVETVMYPVQRGPPQSEPSSCDEGRPSRSLVLALSDRSVCMRSDLADIACHGWPKLPGQ